MTVIDTDPTPPHGIVRPVPMAAQLLRVVVHGLPVTQGSMQPFNDKRGNARMRHSEGHDLDRWRDVVGVLAVGAHRKFGHRTPLDGPLEIRATFRFPMPKSRSKRDRDAGMIWAPTCKDLDKLQRAVGDALEQANVIKNDARIVRWVASKVEVHNLWTGLDLEILQLVGQP